MSELNRQNVWDDERIDVTAEANFIWAIANKLRGSYMPDKYGDVIIPMTIIRRFECALEKTKEKVVAQYNENPNYPAKAMERISGYQFYNTSKYTLAELCNDPDNIASNFKEYINGFSANVQDILRELEMNNHINKMNKDGCLYNTVKAFSELDLFIETFDSIKMGYIFENLLGRFYQNVDAGQYYTGRDIIKMIVSVLMAEGCDDIFDKGKVITICDQACGTGGMLSTAYSYIKQLNPSADIRLFGQEYMGVSYAMGLAEMLIKGQNAENFRYADTFKEDCFPDIDMRFVIENPPFGTPWQGEHAKVGQKEAVLEEYAKGFKGRWGAGLPSGGDSQMLFLQSAINKMDDKVGRCAIIENGSPLFNGGTASGESQIRKWLLENDLIEAIIAMPTDLFYNTGIETYVWILSKNKRAERKGKIQLINASGIFHKLRKPLGNKKNEFNKEDRAKITKLYSDFKENEFVQIYDNSEFIYKEYSIMQPLQRSYCISNERIEKMISNGALSFLYDESKVYEWEYSTEISDKERKKLEEFKKNKPLFDSIISCLNNNVASIKYKNPGDFAVAIEPLVASLVTDKKTQKKIIEKLVEGLSAMDKTSRVQTDKKGNIIYDKETKEIEFVKITENIEDYMRREVYPYAPDAAAFFEEDLGKKKPIIKTGAEIPFPKYFYIYNEPETTEKLSKEIDGIESKPHDKYKRMKSSSIDWIIEMPEHWEEKPNKYIMKKIKDIPPKYNDEDILSLTMNGVIVRDLDAGGKMPASFDGYQKLTPGNLLMCLFDYDVTPRCIGLIKNKGVTSPAYSQFELKDNNYAPYYYYYYLMIDNTKELLHLAKNLRHSFTEDQLGLIKAPVPPVEEQKKIAKYLDSSCADIDAMILEKKKEIEKLEEYKKSLIYEYVTGKKEVTDNE